MSRHEFTAPRGKRVVLGWDNGTRSFFYQVFGSPRARVPGRFGGMDFDEIPHTDALAARLKTDGVDPNGLVPAGSGPPTAWADLAAGLERDRLGAGFSAGVPVRGASVAVRLSVARPPVDPKAEDSFLAALPEAFARRLGALAHNPVVVAATVLDARDGRVRVRIDNQTLEGTGLRAGAHVDVDAADILAIDPDRVRFAAGQSAHEALAGLPETIRRLRAAGATGPSAENALQIFAHYAGWPFSVVPAVEGRAVPVAQPPHLSTVLAVGRTADGRPSYDTVRLAELRNGQYRPLSRRDTLAEAVADLGPVETRLIALAGNADWGNAAVEARPQFSAGATFEWNRSPPRANDALPPARTIIASVDDLRRVGAMASIDGDLVLDGTLPKGLRAQIMSRLAPRVRGSILTDWTGQGAVGAARTINHDRRPVPAAIAAFSAGAPPDKSNADASRDDGPWTGARVHAEGPRRIAAATPADPRLYKGPFTGAWIAANGPRLIALAEADRRAASKPRFSAGAGDAASLARAAIAREFPDFPLDSLPEIPASFEARPWRHDAMPAWRDERAGFTLWIDHPDSAERVEPGAPRFTLIDDRDDFRALAATDEWSQVVSALEEARSARPALSAGAALAEASARARQHGRTSGAAAQGLPPVVSEAVVAAAATLSRWSEARRTLDAALDVVHLQAGSEPALVADGRAAWEDRESVRLRVWSRMRADWRQTLARDYVREMTRQANRSLAFSAGRTMAAGLGLVLAAAPAAAETHAVRGPFGLRVASLETGTPDGADIRDSAGRLVEFYRPAPDGFVRLSPEGRVIGQIVRGEDGTWTVSDSGKPPALTLVPDRQGGYSIRDGAGRPIGRIEPGADGKPAFSAGAVAAPAIVRPGTRAELDALLKGKNPTVAGTLVIDLPDRDLKGFAFPEGTRIERDLMLAGANVRKLGRAMRIGGDLFAPESRLRDLPDDLTIGGSIRLEGSRLERLPDGLAVPGDLSIASTRLDRLPEGLTVGGTLDARSTFIRELPSTLKVGRSLLLSHTPIADLGDLAEVDGDLDLRHTDVSALPADLRVAGALSIADSAIRRVPNGVVAGRIHGGNATLVEPDAADIIAERNDWARNDVPESTLAAVRAWAAENPAQATLAALAMGGAALAAARLAADGLPAFSAGTERARAAASWLDLGEPARGRFVLAAFEAASAWRDGPADASAARRIAHYDDFRREIDALARAAGIRHVDEFVQIFVGTNAAGDFTSARRLQEALDRDATGELALVQARVPAFGAGAGVGMDGRTIAEVIAAGAASDDLDAAQALFVAHFGVDGQDYADWGSLHWSGPIEGPDGQDYECESWAQIPVEVRAKRLAEFAAAFAEEIAITEAEKRSGTRGERGVVGLAELPDQLLATGLPIRSDMWHAATLVPPDQAAAYGAALAAATGMPEYAGLRPPPGNRTNVLILAAFETRAEALECASTMARTGHGPVASTYDPQGNRTATIDAKLSRIGRAQRAPTEEELASDRNFFSDLIRSAPMRAEGFPFFALDPRFATFPDPGPQAEDAPSYYVALGVRFEKPAFFDSKVAASRALLGRDVYHGLAQGKAGAMTATERAILDADQAVGEAARAAGHDAIVYPDEVQVIDRRVLPPLEPIRDNFEMGTSHLANGDVWTDRSGIDAYIKRLGFSAGAGPAVPLTFDDVAGARLAARAIATGGGDARLELVVDHSGIYLRVPGDTTPHPRAGQSLPAGEGTYPDIDVVYAHQADPAHMDAGEVERVRNAAFGPDDFAIAFPARELAVGPETARRRAVFVARGDRFDLAQENAGRWNALRYAATKTWTLSERRAPGPQPAKDPKGPKFSAGILAVEHPRADPAAARAAVARGLAARPDSLHRYVGETADRQLAAGAAAVTHITAIPVRSERAAVPSFVAWARVDDEAARREGRFQPYAWSHSVEALRADARCADVPLYALVPERARDASGGPLEGADGYARVPVPSALHAVSDYGMRDLSADLVHARLTRGDIAPRIAFSGGTLTFDRDHVLRLVEAARTGTPSQSFVESHENRPAERGLMLVGDDGIYLMAKIEDGPKHPLGGTDAPSGSRYPLLDVAYAHQADPLHMDADMVWERKRAYFGGDDGAKTIDLDSVEKLLSGGRNLVIRLTPESMELLSLEDPAVAVFADAAKRDWKFSSGAGTRTLYRALGEEWDPARAVGTLQYWTDDRASAEAIAATLEGGRVVQADVTTANPFVLASDADAAAFRDLLGLPPGPPPAMRTDLLEHPDAHAALVRAGYDSIVVEDGTGRADDRVTVTLTPGQVALRAELASWRVEIDRQALAQILDAADGRAIASVPESRAKDIDWQGFRLQVAGGGIDIVADDGQGPVASLKAPIPDLLFKAIAAEADGVPVDRETVEALARSRGHETVAFVLRREAGGLAVAAAPESRQVARTGRPAALLAAPAAVVAAGIAGSAGLFELGRRIAETAKVAPAQLAALDAQRLAGLERLKAAVASATLPDGQDAAAVARWAVARADTAAEAARYGVKLNIPSVPGTIPHEVAHAMTEAVHAAQPYWKAVGSVDRVHGALEMRGAMGDWSWPLHANLEQAAFEVYRHFEPLVAKAGVASAWLGQFLADNAATATHVAQALPRLAFSGGAGLSGQAQEWSDRRDAIAERFAGLLQATVPAEAFAEIRRRNAAETGRTTCHSHAFTDSNLVMAQAFREVVGRDAVIDDTPAGIADVALWNGAWDRALDAGLVSDRRADPDIGGALALSAGVQRRRADIPPADHPILVTASINRSAIADMLQRDEGIARGAALKRAFARGREIVAKIATLAGRTPGVRFWDADGGDVNVLARDRKSAERFRADLAGAHLPWVADAVRITDIGRGAFAAGRPSDERSTQDMDTIAANTRAANALTPVAGLPVRRAVPAATLGRRLLRLTLATGIGAYVWNAIETGARALGAWAASTERKDALNALDTLNYQTLKMRDPALEQLGRAKDALDAVLASGGTDPAAMARLESAVHANLDAATSSMHAYLAKAAAIPGMDPQVVARVASETDAKLAALRASIEGSGLASGAQSVETAIAQIRASADAIWQADPLSIQPAAHLATNATQSLDELGKAFGHFHQAQTYAWRDLYEPLRAAAPAPVQPGPTFLDPYFARAEQLARSAWDAAATGSHEAVRSLEAAVADPAGSAKQIAGLATVAADHVAAFGHGFVASALPLVEQARAAIGFSAGAAPDLPAPRDALSGFLDAAEAICAAAAPSVQSDVAAHAKISKALASGRDKLELAPRSPLVHSDLIVDTRNEIFTDIEAALARIPDAARRGALRAQLDRVDSQLMAVAASLSQTAAPAGVLAELAAGRGSAFAAGVPDRSKAGVEAAGAPGHEAIVAKAAAEADIDKSALTIQDYYGETDGGLASLYFSGRIEVDGRQLDVHDDWASLTPAQRRESVLDAYAAAERYSYVEDKLAQIGGFEPARLDFDSPEGRAAAIELLGPKAYSVALEAWNDASKVATVNGHAIRKTQTRFGVVFAVGASGRAFSSVGEAGEFARTLPAGGKEGPAFAAGAAASAEAPRAGKVASVNIDSADPLADVMAKLARGEGDEIALLAEAFADPATRAIIATRYAEKTGIDVAKARAEIDTMAGHIAKVVEHGLTIDKLAEAIAAIERLQMHQARQAADIVLDATDLPADVAEKIANGDREGVALLAKTFADPKIREALVARHAETKKIDVAQARADIDDMAAHLDDCARKGYTIQTVETRHVGPLARALEVLQAVSPTDAARAFAERVNALAALRHGWRVDVAASEGKKLDFRRLGEIVAMEGPVAADDSAARFEFRSRPVAHAFADIAAATLGNDVRVKGPSVALVKPDAARDAFHAKILDDAHLHMRAIDRAASSVLRAHHLDGTRIPGTGRRMKRDLQTALAALRSAESPDIRDRMVFQTRAKISRDVPNDLARETALVAFAGQSPDIPAKPRSIQPADLPRALSDLEKTMPWHVRAALVPYRLTNRQRVAAAVAIGGTALTGVPLAAAAFSAGASDDAPLPEDFARWTPTERFLHRVSSKTVAAAGLGMTAIGGTALAGLIDNPHHVETLRAGAARLLGLSFSAGASDGDVALVRVHGISEKRLAPPAAIAIGRVRGADSYLCRPGEVDAVRAHIHRRAPNASVSSAIVPAGEFADHGRDEPTGLFARVVEILNPLSMPRHQLRGIVAPAAIAGTASVALLAAGPRIVDFARSEIEQFQAAGQADAARHAALGSILQADSEVAQIFSARIEALAREGADALDAVARTGGDPAAVARLHDALAAKAAATGEAVQALMAKVQAIPGIEALHADPGFAERFADLARAGNSPEIARATSDALEAARAVGQAAEAVWQSDPLSTQPANHLAGLVDPALAHLATAVDALDQAVLAEGAAFDRFASSVSSAPLPATGYLADARNVAEAAWQSASAGVGRAASDLAAVAAPYAEKAHDAATRLTDDPVGTLSRLGTAAYDAAGQIAVHGSHLVDGGLQMLESARAALGFSAGASPRDHEIIVRIGGRHGEAHDQRFAEIERMAEAAGGLFTFREATIENDEAKKTSVLKDGMDCGFAFESEEAARGFMREMRDLRAKGGLDGQIGDVDYNGPDGERPEPARPERPDTRTAAAAPAADRAPLKRGREPDGLFDLLRLQNGLADLSKSVDRTLIPVTKIYSGLTDQSTGVRGAARMLIDFSIVREGGQVMQLPTIIVDGPQGPDIAPRVEFARVPRGATREQREAHEDAVEMKEAKTLLTTIRRSMQAAHEKRIERPTGRALLETLGNAAVEFGVPADEIGLARPPARGEKEAFAFAAGAAAAVPPAPAAGRFVERPAVPVPARGAAAAARRAATPRPEQRRPEQRRVDELLVLANPDNPTEAVAKRKQLAADDTRMLEIRARFITDAYEHLREGMPNSLAKSCLRFGSTLIVEELARRDMKDLAAGLSRKLDEPQAGMSVADAIATTKAARQTTRSGRER